MEGNLSFSGHIEPRIIKAPPDIESAAVVVKDSLDKDPQLRGKLSNPSFLEIMHLDLLRSLKIDEVYRWKWNNLPQLWRGLWRVYLARKLGLPHLYGSLSLTKVFADGKMTDYGLASMRVVTSVGAEFIVDCCQNLASAEMENLRYHGIGRSTAAELASNTALGNEWTSAYYSGSSRATGTLTEGANSTTFRTVGTNTYITSAVAVTAIGEHGIFHVPSVGSGILLDRSIFSTINLNAGDALQGTYDLVIASGS